ncbi:MAG: ATP-dependent protease LonB [Lachnospiraceae bacterium]|nr:ATP-dependent protease LonB [Lachnospiraceae bacterium]
MNLLYILLMVSQLLFTAVAGMYFYKSLRVKEPGKGHLDINSIKELEKIRSLRRIKLSSPLSEKTRPKSLNEIIGQGNAVKALKAVLCSKNPQHVIIYGPPGVGKTAAARLILEEAKKSPSSPFGDFSKFIEIDATTLRFDERSIADPLIGCVHDPIYQGAGAYGIAGIPQPKEGAVTKANGGILFIDEIGELNPMQMNKLLKVLEDRKVFFTSAYYSSENKNIPEFIHDIFKFGLPADFRLVGATTREPRDIPPALRSRCTEIYFEPLKDWHLKEIARGAALKANILLGEKALDEITRYASNGRDAVNIVETAASVAAMDGRREVCTEDIEWIAESGRYTPKIPKKLSDDQIIGKVNGLAVLGGDIGAVIDIEAGASKSKDKKGSFRCTGIIEEEEIKNAGGCFKRKSTAASSMEAVLTAFDHITGTDTKNYDIHINFPGGMPVDGPSAGAAVFLALYSCIYKKPVSQRVALTGEISIFGDVLPVGGVYKKIEAAAMAGAKTVFIPWDNWKKTYEDMEINVIGVKNINEIISGIEKTKKKETIISADEKGNEMLSAMSAEV